MREGLVHVLPPAIRDVVLPRDGDGDVGVSNGVFFAHASPMRIGGAAYNVVEQDLVFNTEDEDIQILGENRLVPPSLVVDTTMTPPSTPNARLAASTPANPITPASTTTPRTTRNIPATPVTEREEQTQDELINIAFSNLTNVWIGSTTATFFDSTREATMGALRQLASSSFISSIGMGLVGVIGYGVSDSRARSLLENGFNINNRQGRGNVLRTWLLGTVVIGIGGVLRRNKSSPSSEKR